MIRHARHKTRDVALFLAALFGMNACTVGPNYKPDKLALPSRFTEAPHQATPSDIAANEAELTRWWAAFKDPILTKLVETAITGNYDLKIADQRIIAERALRQRAASSWYPQLDINAGGGTNRYSTVIGNWPIRPGNPANHPQASVLTYGATASWEIDVFGRIRREVEASDRAIDVSIEARRATLMMLLSSVARNYILLRGNQLKLSIVMANVARAEGALLVTQQLYHEGVGNTLQIAQAQSERDRERAELEPLQLKCEKLIHAISVLLGEMPGDLRARLDIPLQILRQKQTWYLLPRVPTLPATLPSIVVANRPDIRQAEREYAEATAEIGMAVAQIYPQFSIPLTFNPSASALYQAFQINAMSWSALMMASLPLVHGGRLTAQIAAARARAEASRQAYRKSLLTGFQEVEDAFSSWTHDAQWVTKLHLAADESAVASDRARRLHAAGLIDFLNVLTTQQAMLDAQSREADARIANVLDAVDLYVAIGAGWQDNALRQTQLPVSVTKQNALSRAFSR